MILGIIILLFVMLEFIGEDAICTRIRSIFCFNNAHLTAEEGKVTVLDLFKNVFKHA